MSNINSIKANLAYSNADEQERAYESWFTVIAILADAYADHQLEKEEAICRWVVRERKIPRPLGGMDLMFLWSDEDGWVAYSIHSILPFSGIELAKMGLRSSCGLLVCLDRLLAIPYEYLDRFR